MKRVHFAETYGADLIPDLVSSVSTKDYFTLYLLTGLHGVAL